MSTSLDIQEEILEQSESIPPLTQSLDLNQNQYLQYDQDYSTAINNSLHQYTYDTYSKKNGLKKHYIHQIKKMKVGTTKQICSVCINRFQKSQIISKLPCQHILHKNCSKQWFKVNQRCPICRFHLGVHFMNIQIEQLKQKQKKQKEKFDYKCEKMQI